MCAARSRDLSISSQQLVEIAKALTLDCRVLIFDEPTAALTETEAQALFGIIRDLKAQRHFDHLYQPPHGRNLLACATASPCSATDAMSRPSASPT